MTVEQKQSIYDLVGVVCGETTDVSKEQAWEAAYEILRIAGVSPCANIVEIPLCHSHQVCIRFTLGETFSKAHEIFALSAGISISDASKFFFDLQIEDYEGKFPGKPDDDMGYYLRQEYWEIKEFNTPLTVFNYRTGKIVSTKDKQEEFPKTELNLGRDAFSGKPVVYKKGEDHKSLVLGHPK